MSSNPEQTPRRRSFQQKMLDAGMVALLLGVLVAVGFLSGIVGMRFAIRRTEVPVPNVTARPVAEAEVILEEAELGIEVIGERYDEATPKGAILAQLPRAGGRLKARREVQVMVSLGKRTSPVPDLIGKTLRVARLTAEEYNYEIGHVSEMSLPGRREGIVSSQYPPPGSETAVSPRINLLVSKGDPQAFVMPDLLGRNLNEVKPFLEGRGFELASIQYDFYRNANRGTVVKQFPEPGYLVTKEDSINLEVAR